MKIYTSGLTVIPKYKNRLRINSSYSYQHEVFRSTLIVLPNSNGKRFIEGIAIRCGNFMNDQTFIINNHLTSVSPVVTSSDILSADESICEYYPTKKGSIIAESYSDVRHRLLAKSNLLTYALDDDTDDDSYYSPSSIGYSYHHIRKKN